MAAQLDEPDVLLKQIISSLYVLMVQISEYDSASSQQAMTSELQQFIETLRRLKHSGQEVTLRVPEELVSYVENTRNPDIFTRTFTEETMRLNQELKGKTAAFGAFRDILAREMMTALPDIKNEICQIAESTGGRLES